MGWQREPLAAITQFCSPATTIPTATSVKPSAPSSAAFHFGAGFIYIEGSASELRTVQFGNRLLTLILIRHLNERKSARPSRVTIRHECYSIHLAVLPKESTQVIFKDVEIEIADKNVFHREVLSDRGGYLNVGIERRERGSATVAPGMGPNISNAGHSIAPPEHG